MTFSSTSVAFPHPLFCPKLCELILHRKDVTCEAKDYYIFIFIKCPSSPASQQKQTGSFNKAARQKGKHNQRLLQHPAQKSNRKKKSNGKATEKSSQKKDPSGEDTVSGPSGCVSHTHSPGKERTAKETVVQTGKIRSCSKQVCF